MFCFKQIVIGDGERALLYSNRRFERVLSPGVYRLLDPRNRSSVTTHNLIRPECSGNDVEVLMAHGWPAGRVLPGGDIGTDQVGLVLENGKLEDVLAPGTCKLYWKGIVPIELQGVSLAASLELDARVASRLRQLGLLAKVAATVDVPTELSGLLFVDSNLLRRLAPGAYAFWNFGRSVSLEVIELRVQSLEVSGQELLTRDKVSLRVNLAASLHVVDPVAARTRVTKYGDYLYGELQYGLRKAVSGKTLDELLGDKASLDADIFANVRGRVGELGLEVLVVGVKDVILPGEMKETLNRVVQAEKAAAANVIRRREQGICRWVTREQQ
jgi:hypothetical protein